MRNNKGFTLVELMVVMAIIAILATAGITQYSKFISKSRDTARLADLKSIETTLTANFGQDGIFPTNLDVEAKIKSATGKTFKDPSAGKNTCLAVVGTAGVDTANQCNYQYAQCGGGSGFMLRVKLENPETNPSDSVVLGGAATTNNGYYEIGDCQNNAAYPSTFENINGVAN